MTKNKAVTCCPGRAVADGLETTSCRRPGIDCSCVRKCLRSEEKVWYMLKRGRERIFLWKGKEFHYGAVSVRMYILIFPVLTSAFSSRVAWVHLWNRSSVATRQTLKSASHVAFKARYGGFLFFSQKHKPMALWVAFQTNSSQIRGFPLPSFGKAEHVYQEEKWLLGSLSGSGSCPGLHFVMPGEVHLCPTQCFHKKARFQVFIWTSVTSGLQGLGVEDVCIV